MGGSPGEKLSAGDPEEMSGQQEQAAALRHDPSHRVITSRHSALSCSSRPRTLAASC